MTEKDRQALKEKTKQVEAAAAELEAAALVDENPSNNQNQPQDIPSKVEESKEAKVKPESLREPVQQSIEKEKEEKGGTEIKRSNTKRGKNKKRRK